MINYGFTKEIDASFEETLDKVSNEFEQSGTSYNPFVKQKLKKFK